MLIYQYTCRRSVALWLWMFDAPILYFDLNDRKSTKGINFISSKKPTSIPSPLSISVRFNHNWKMFCSSFLLIIPIIMCKYANDWKCNIQIPSLPSSFHLLGVTTTFFTNNRPLPPISCHCHKGKMGHCWGGENCLSLFIHFSIIFRAFITTMPFSSQSHK